jgi:diphthamide synthase (EF-2-diphthine--ammonia ligase)
MKHIYSCSFGKDSLAQIILAHENNLQVDYIVYCEVMFDHKKI